MNYKLPEPAEQAYENWLDVGNNRYGSVHRDAFIAGYEAGSTATFEQGYTQGFRAAAREPTFTTERTVPVQKPIERFP